ncbi:MAG: RNA polymerase sigma factor [Acidimicrobiales bacterium]
MSNDAELVARLRAGDEAAFVALVDQFHAPMLRFASTFVPSRAVAEEVVQESWLGVVRGIGGFEGRSTLRTWLFSIVANCARRAGARERRQVPVDFDDERGVPEERFGRGGEWTSPPVPWPDDAVERIAAVQVVASIRGCFDALPAAQRQAVLLRDFEGLPSSEVCGLLGISEGNLRVLLHRGRARIRNQVELDVGRN